MLLVRRVDDINPSLKNRCINFSVKGVSVWEKMQISAENEALLKIHAANSETSSFGPERIEESFRRLWNIVTNSRVTPSWREIVSLTFSEVASLTEMDVWGSPPSRVILFGDIPTVIPSTFVVAPETSTIAPVISSAAPVVETTLVVSPTGLCGLIPYSDSDSDSPYEMSSPEHISTLPAISPFLCIDSFEAPNSSGGPPSQDPYVATVARWRSRVTTRPSSSSEFPIAPVIALPGIRRCSSSGSLPIHSSGLDAPDQDHSGSSIRDVSPRLGYPPRRAPLCSEAFRHWCATQLSTLYPPTTSESSSGDSSERPLYSSSHSVGPSCKRCRS
ncbi:hypothetical protein Tco_1057436 [Tanacetum coccineum]|uniref:Uncharacterized protein n=1 Tax=Tanacetum coccineum TaxID=301880 RepID=A0ABQ5H5L5_9ASTR